MSFLLTRLLLVVAVWIASREAPSRTWLWVCGMETNAYQDMSVQGHHNSWEKRKHLVGMSCSKLQHPGTPQHINNGHSSCLNTIKRSSGTKKVRTRISTYFLYSVSIPTGIYPFYSPDFLWLSIETSNLKFPFIPANSPKGTGGQETVGGWTISNFFKSYSRLRV